MSVAGKVGERKSRAALGLLAQYLSSVIQAGLESGTYDLAGGVIVLGEAKVTPALGPERPGDVVRRKERGENGADAGAAEHWVEFTWSHAVSGKRAQIKR